MTPQGPMVIDVNPRLVEPANAYYAGVDLVAAMLSLVDGTARAGAPAGRPDVLTRQSLLVLLGAAQRGEGRGAILRQALGAMLARGAFAGSAEELTPVAGDPAAALPVAAALAALLAHPPLWRKFHTGAVGPYALTEEAWRTIVASAVP